MVYYNLQEYQTQLHLESAFKGKGRKLVDEKGIDNGTSHKNGNAAATKETSSSLSSVSSVSAVNGNDALSKEKKAAAEAALARIKALQQKEDESKRIVARQAALIKGRRERKNQNCVYFMFFFRNS